MTWSHRRRNSPSKGGKARPKRTHLAILTTPEWAGRRLSCPGLFRRREVMLRTARHAGTALLRVCGCHGGQRGGGEGSFADTLFFPLLLCPTTSEAGGGSHLSWRGGDSPPLCSPTFPFSLRGEGRRRGVCPSAPTPPSALLCAVGPAQCSGCFCGLLA